LTVVLESVPRVLVVRPPRNEDDFVSRLETLGCDVEVLPVMAIRELSRQGAVTGLIARLDSFQKAIFISRIAARIGAQAIGDYWKRLPAGLDFFAVGASTASVLEATLQRSHQKPVCFPRQRADTEALLSLPEMQSVDGENIVIFRGVGGRETLGAMLKARGANVVYGELYVRELDRSHHEAIGKLLLSGNLDMVVAHSGELITYLGTVAGPETLSALLAIPVLVPGERVAAIARQAGFRQIVIADSAVAGSMADAFGHWYTAARLNEH